MDVRRRRDRVGALADDADDRALRDDVASPDLAEASWSSVTA